MQYKEFHPPSHLADYVQLIWGMTSESSNDQFSRERILPDGIVELVFHFAEPFKTFRADGTSYIQPAAFAISQMREFIEIESAGEVGFLAARFYPWVIVGISTIGITAFALANIGRNADSPVPVFFL